MIALSKRATRNMKRFPACMAAGAMLLASGPAVAAISGPATVTEGDSYTLTWSFPGTRLRLSPASGGSATSIWSGSSATFTNAQTGTYTYIEELCVALFGTQSCASVDTHTVTVNARTPAPAPTSTPVPPPPVPTGLKVPSTNDTGRYSAMWNASPGATRYQLQERISSGGWRTVHNRPATRKSFSGKGSATYHYRVRACAASCSGWSGTDSVRLVRASGTPGPVPEPLWVPVAGGNGTTMMVAVAPLPPAPGRTQVPGVSTDGAVTVTWDAVAGAPMRGGLFLFERRDKIPRCHSGSRSWELPSRVRLGLQLPSCSKDGSLFSVWTLTFERSPVPLAPLRIQRICNRPWGLSTPLTAILRGRVSFFLGYPTLGYGAGPSSCMLLTSRISHPVKRGQVK